MECPYPMCGHKDETTQTRCNQCGTRWIVFIHKGMRHTHYQIWRAWGPQAVAGDYKPLKREDLDDKKIEAGIRYNDETLVILGKK